LSELYETHVPLKRRYQPITLQGIKNPENFNLNLPICVCTQFSLDCLLIPVTLSMLNRASKFHTVAKFVIAYTRINFFYRLGAYLCQLGYLSSQKNLHALNLMNSSVCIGVRYVSLMPPDRP
jgi:hypothetical protein